MSMTPCGGARLRQTGRRVRLQRSARVERAAGHDQHAAGRAGDRRGPAAQGLGLLTSRRSQAATDALRNAHAAGVGGSNRAGLLIVRADSAYYTHDMVAAARRGGARFSITAKMTATVKAAIAGIGEAAGAPVHYPNATLDEDQPRRVSHAQGAQGAL